jgi:hypothetical protein
MVPMDTLILRYGRFLHPEFHRRLFAWIESMDGLIGCGQTYRAVQPSKPGFAPPGMSFHEKQRFASGLNVVSAVDLVARAWPGNPNQAHRSPTWEESGTAPNYGVYTFVKGEPWHMQCVEMRGYQTWVNAGRPDPGPFTLPNTPPPIIPSPSREVDMYVIEVVRAGWPTPVDLVVAADGTRWNANGHTSALDQAAGVPRVARVSKEQALGILVDRDGIGPHPFNRPEYLDAELAAAWG